MIPNSPEQNPAIKKPKEPDPIVGITRVNPPVYTDIPYTNDPYYFHTHPIISALGKNERWTLSGVKSKTGKVPIDAWFYVDRRGEKIGARGHDSTYLMTLENVYKSFYNEICYMQNVPYVYFLDCFQDNLVCLDVEPDCDENLKQLFLKLPFLYGEFSMSGKGLHLILPLPKHIFDKYAAAQKKIKMQNANEGYEILLYHYMTFTCNMIQPVQNPVDISEFYKVFEKECIKQTEAEVKKQVNAELIPPENIPGFNNIMARMRYGSTNPKLPSHYPTMSHYEYGTASIVMHRLYRILRDNPVYLMMHRYTDEEIIMLIYYRLVDVLQHRDKHDTERDGLPYLVYVVRDIVSKNPFTNAPGPLPKNAMPK